MDKVRKLELIERSLGIRHKLKVHDSMKGPESHEELALMMMTKWDLEDELRAIEEILADARVKNVALKRKIVGDENENLPPEERKKATAARLQAKASKKKDR
jgi:hypothetical protein